MATAPPKPSHKSVLELGPVTLEDLPQVRAVWYAAFESPFIMRLWPNTPSVHKWWDDANSSSILHDPTARYMKVTDLAADDGKGKIIAYAKWNAPRRDPTKKGYGDRFPPYPQDGDVEGLSTFFGHLTGEREKFMGDRPHYYLDMLGTLPEYQGLGAGTLLVKWGCDAADEEGVEAFVDASEAGKGLYEKYGFVEKDGWTMPGESFRVASLLRPAKS